MQLQAIQGRLMFTKPAGYSRVFINNDMKNSFYPFLLAALLISTETITSTAGTLVTISKRQENGDIRKVSGYNGISSSGNFDVRVRMGSREGLRLEGDKEAIDDIETFVEKGVLRIKNKSKSGWNFRRGKVIIYVDAKSLNSITLNGSGIIAVSGNVRAEKMTNTLSGSGKIVLTTDVEEYLGTISGSGALVVKGAADRARINVSGSGDFEGQNLKTSEARISISGSGNASISAEKFLHAAVSGSGNIRYSGNARVTQSKSGSGSIRKI